MQIADLLQHEHASLMLAQRCSAVRAPTPLFSALMNYRHVSIAERDAAPWEGIHGVYGEERTNYALTLSVNDAGDELGLTVQAVAPIDAARGVRVHAHGAGVAGDGTRDRPNISGRNA